MFLAVNLVLLLFISVSLSLSTSPGVNKLELCRYGALATPGGGLGGAIAYATRTSRGDGYDLPYSRIGASSEAARFRARGIYRAPSGWAGRCHRLAGQPG